MKFNSFVQNAGDNTELVGFLNGFTHQPTIESGPFIVNKQTTKDIIYQVTPVQLNFTVLHTHLTGWVLDTTSNRYSFGSSDKPEIGRDYPHYLGDALGDTENARDRFEFEASARAAPFLVVNEDEPDEERKSTEAEILAALRGEVD